MFDWPPANQTSPTATSLSSIAAPQPFSARITWPVPAGSAGNSTRHSPSAPARTDLRTPSNETWTVERTGAVPAISIGIPRWKTIWSE